MNIFHSISDFTPAKKTIVTLGTFDGVHIGHRKIIEKLISSTLEGTYESLILTFFPHPRMILQADSKIKLLNTIEEKSVLLGQIGLDHLVIHPFDKDFSRLTAEDFVKKVLVEQFNIHKIIIGHDHRFGRNRTATIDDLIIYGEQYGFEVEQISAQEINEVSVSSTKIRTALAEGNITLANSYLGYPYFFTGVVVQGKQLGRTLGFPTANIRIKDEHKLIPKNGVYVVQSIIEQRTVYGMMNIGFNPTIGEEGVLTIEVHFFDFNSDLYHKEIVISILFFIRKEEKFDSLLLLQIQLEKDKRVALQLLNTQ